MSTLYGTDDDDILNGGNGADLIYGGLGGDHINGGSGADSLYGEDGNDDLIGGGGNDALNGGIGDDILNGGGGADKFVFNFTVDVGSGTTLYFPGFGDATSVSQGTFSATVDAWLQAIIAAGGGVDLNSDGVISCAVNANNGDPDGQPPTIEGFLGFSDLLSITVTQGHDNSRPESYWGCATIGGGLPAITASDGYDTISQFQNGGSNIDTIELNGITHDQAAALFSLTTSDVNLDTTLDTVISWGGAGAGSITILGVSWADLTSFLGDSRIHFS